MKKITALLVMALFLMSFAVSAADITGMDKDIAGAAVTVSGNGFVAGEKITARILYPNVTSVADGKQTNTIAWMGEAVADENGNVVFTAGMPDDTDKQIVVFNLELISSDGTKVSKVLKWVDNDGLTETVLNIKQATSASAAMNEIITKADALDITFIEPWKNMSPAQKEKIGISLYAERDDFVLFDDAVAKLNYLILQEAMNSSSSQTEFFNLLNTYKNLLDQSLFDETATGLEGEIKSEFETRFYDMRSKLDGSSDAFKYTFKEAVLAANIKKLDRNAPLIKILKDYADVIIKADSDMKDVMDDFKTASEDDQLAVCDALLEERATNLSKICDIIEETLYEDNNGGGGSSGGGGGGGSGSGGVTGGYSVSTQMVTAPINPPANPIQPTMNFGDIDKTHYAYEGVQYLAAKGVINGYSENGRNIFKPDADMTREEFVKMVLLAFDFEIGQAEYGFTDVAPDSWYAPYVNTAAKLGIVNGVGDSKFGVGTKITREQMCTLIYRTAMQKQINIAGKGDSLEFADKTEISGYAIEAAQALKAAGIVSGDENGNFNPGANATRANAAKVLYGIITID